LAGRTAVRPYISNGWFLVRLRHKDLLGLAHLNADEIELILNTAVPFKKLFTRSIKKVPPLRGKTVAFLFYEPSTRTRTSFELAATRLSADVLSLAVSSSSVQKGESLTDTALNLEAMKIDYIVLRHSVSGAPELLARAVKAHVVNAVMATMSTPHRDCSISTPFVRKRKRFKD
jgi:aspartate carbamoyltransferase catalytic subunit